MDNECRSQTDLSNLDCQNLKSEGFQSNSESHEINLRKTNYFEEDTKTKTAPKLRNKGRVIYEFSYEPSHRF